MNAFNATERLSQLRDALLTGLVERDLPVRLALIASLAGEHLLMVGPPGTAKSLVARRLHLAFAESSYFERLLTRFTVPEELFGPLSIKGLEEDRYERLTEKYLPTASIAFLDEIFKANSAILNSLLTLLNEREFDNGTRRDKTPLIAVIGASNELPESEELDALFDRFLLRVHVGSVSKEGFSSLIGLRGNAAPNVPESLKLAEGDLLAIQAEAEKVNLPDDVLALLNGLREWCAVESIQVSDRRWRKIVKLLQVSAWTNGRGTVSIWDCWLLQHCLWNRAEDRRKIYDWYAARVGANSAMDTSKLTRVVVAWEGQLKADQNSRSLSKVNHLYLAHPRAMAPGAIRFIGTDRSNKNKGFTLAELDAMKIEDPIMTPFSTWSKRAAYLANKDNWHSCIEPTCHKQIYIDDSLRQIDGIKAQVMEYQAQLNGHIESIKTEICSHLWVTTDFMVPAAENLKQTQQALETLLARLNKIREGFELLPREVDFSELMEDGMEEEAPTQ